MIGTVEVKKKEMDRKDRSKKKKEFGQMHFRPFVPVQFSYLEVPGHTKSQPAQHRKSFGLTFDRPYLI